MVKYKNTLFYIIVTGSFLLLMYWMIQLGGLMELIVLNIGFELGVLNAELFTMMVLMALVTTFMTGPALDLINRSSKMTINSKYKPLQEIDAGNEFCK